MEPQMARIGPPPKRSTKGTPPPATDAARPANLDRPAPGDWKPLNFRVPTEFHRELKSYAANHGVSMLEVLIEGFRLVKERQP
jgi:HicB-like protein involved in pilus formation